jgi:hypothetical protein
MKLPDNPAERKKMLLAFGILGASILYLGVKYGVLPLIQKSKNRTKQVTQLEDLVFEAERKIKKLDTYREELAEFQAAVLDASERKQYVLHHNLGNYRLVAESIILPHLKQAGMRVAKTSPNSWKEEVNSDISSEGIPKGRRFVPFGLAVTCSGSFIQLIAAIDAIEQSNPYICIGAINVKTTADAPQTQSFQLLIKWPAWTTDEIKMAITLSAVEQS